MSTEPKRNETVKKLVGNEKGFLLIAALTLLTVLTLLGTTAYILSSTDIKVGSNYRNTQLALQVAIGGVEQARAKLVSDLYPSSGALVSLSTELAAVKGPNNVLNGYATSTDDIALASGSLNGATYVAYLTNDNLPGGEAYNSTTDSNGKVLITSVATGPNNATARVEMIVYSPVGLASSPATVYSKDNVTLNGSAITIGGNDGGSCSGTNRAPIYRKDPGTTTLNGGPNLSGSPSTAQNGTTDLDLQTMVDQLKGAATYTLTNDVSDATYGDASHYVTVYADAAGTQADHELRLNNVTGYGILIVKGDLQLGGNINWHGIIIATGVMTSSGGGSNSKQIQGLVFVGSSSLGDSAISGNINIQYNSCEVKYALSLQEIKVVNWKQSY